MSGVSIDMTLFDQESYEIGSDENREHYNIWLPEQVLPGFREFTTLFYWKPNDVATGILEALMMGAGFNKEEAKIVRKLHTGHTNQLRLLHYPAMSQDVDDGGDQSRLGAHTDWRYGRSSISEYHFIDFVLTMATAHLRSFSKTRVKVSSSWTERRVNSCQRHPSLTRCI